MLSEQSLKQLIADKQLLIEGSSDILKGNAIKLHLGAICKRLTSEIVDIKSLEDAEYEEVDISSGYDLKPNEFLLAYTLEKVTMPKGYMGWIETRGSLANIGFQVHFCDAHIDPESSLHIALQIKNNSNSIIRISLKEYIAKMYVERLV